MDRRSGVAGRLLEPARRAAGRRAECQREIGAAGESGDRADERRLARAGPTGHHRQPALERGLDRPRCSSVRLFRRSRAVGVASRARGRRGEAREVVGERALGLPGAGNAAHPSSTAIAPVAPRSPSSPSGSEPTSSPLRGPAARPAGMCARRAAPRSAAHGRAQPGSGPASPRRRRGHGRSRRRSRSRCRAPRSGGRGRVRTIPTALGPWRSCSGAASQPAPCGASST